MCLSVSHTTRAAHPDHRFPAPASWWSKYIVNHCLEFARAVRYLWPQPAGLTNTVLCSFRTAMPIVAGRDVALFPFCAVSVLVTAIKAQNDTVKLPVGTEGLGTSYRLRAKRWSRKGLYHGPLWPVLTKRVLTGIRLTVLQAKAVSGGLSGCFKIFAKLKCVSIKLWCVCTYMLWKVE